MSTISIILLFLLGLLFLTLIGIILNNNRHKHEYTLWVLSEDKEYQSRICTKCNLYEKQYILPKDCSNGHIYGNWHSTTYSSFQYRYCKICNFKQEKTIW